MVAAHDVASPNGDTHGTSALGPAMGIEDLLGLPAPPMNSATGTLNGDDGEESLPVSPPPVRTRSMEELEGIYETSPTHNAGLQGRPAPSAACPRRGRERERGHGGDGDALRPQGRRPNQLSSPLGTELFARKVAFQRGEGPGLATGLESSEANADPNER